MARNRFTVTTEGELALASTAAKTALQITAPANIRTAIKGFSISFDGVSSTAGPAFVEWVRQTSSGSFAAATAIRDIPSTETIQTGVRKWTSTSTEPSDTGSIRSYNVHPQTGIERSYAEDEELLIEGSGRLALRVTLSSSGPNLTAFVSCEE